MMAKPAQDQKRRDSLLKRKTTVIWQNAMKNMKEMDLKKFTITKLLELQESVQQKADALQEQFDEMQK